jgi:hypothetical protein
MRRLYGDISDENGRQPTLDPLSAHLPKPGKVNPRVKVPRNASWRDGLVRKAVEWAGRQRWRAMSTPKQDSARQLYWTPL